MKKTAYYLFLLLFGIATHGQSTNHNYVAETIYNSSSSTQHPQGISPYNQNITYYDGFGHPIQQIQQNASPDGDKDIITHIEYEKNKGQVRSYLPYAATSQTTPGGGTADFADFVTNARNQTFDFYNTPKYENTPNPYSEQVSEPSARKLILETGAPGTDWSITEGGNDINHRHTIRNEYAYNSSNEVRRFMVSTTWNASQALYTNIIGQGLNYPPGSLQKTIIKDENWKPADGKNHTTETFTGSDGKVVLSRAYNQGEAHDTYYVYDFYGNLAYVIPPLANGTISSGSLEGLIYQYRYDKKNRLVEKKQPGKDWEYMVYDQQDRLVLTQDGNLRSTENTFNARGWMFTKYDVFDRVVYTGFFKNGATRSAMQQALNSMNAPNNETRTTQAATVGGTLLYYTNARFPNGSLTVLTANYYDTNTPERPDYYTTNVYNVAFLPDDPNQPLNTKGLPLATYVRNIEDDKWTRNFNWYDNKKRVMMSRVDNPYGGYSHYDYELTYRGLATTVFTRHRKTMAEPEIMVWDRYTYDKEGRKIRHTHKTGQHPEHLIANFTYDDLGALTTKEVGGLETASPLETVNYKYNVRGWLTDINDANVRSFERKLFNYKISYNRRAGDLGNKVLYNGNINAVVSITKTDNIFRGYAYHYDHLNRLTSAKNIYFRRSGLIGLHTDESYSEHISYDKNGNIAELYRNGETLPNGSVLNVDELDYSYNGNQLLRVDDQSGNTDGFNDGNTSGNDYTYDANGNMKTDKNKGITNIKYNYLNLPSEIQFGNGGKIQYLYDASGTRLQKKVTPQGGTAISTDYLSGFQYEHGLLEFFPHAEGYVSKQNEGYQYVYQYRDHLGNVRLSYADMNGDGLIQPATEILKENNYYPFGLEHTGYNDLSGTHGHAVAQKYKYNGKEFQEEFSLNVTAMDFRQYDNALGRFYSMDALSEASFGHTPYHYGYNNPVYWSDPTGLLSDSFIASIWNNSPDGMNTYWENMGGYFVSSNINDLGHAISVFYDGTVGETLPIMFGEIKRGGGGFLSFPSFGRYGFGEMVRDHAYRYSTYYQYHRDAMRAKQTDNLQGYMEFLGTFDPTGVIDALNSLGYLARGQYGNAATSAIAIVPYVGDLGKGGKYLNKVSKYEKLSDSYGTRAYIKEFNNTTPINTRVLFNDITQGGTKKIINTPQGSIIRSTMSDGSIIQLRNFSTKSGSINHSTIQFIGTQNKWKFNY